MTQIIYGLLIKFQPKAFVGIRKILETNKKLLNTKPTGTNWHEDGKLVMPLILNRPDTEDEGQINFFNHSIEEMVSLLKKAGADVEVRKKVPPLPPLAA